MGALLAHITGGAKAETFQPMNVNFGLFPPLDGADAAAAVDGRGRPSRGRERKKALAARALRDLDRWLGRERRAAE
jgi:methylenetetrahydrofolate--tRNA-(uracil-5-)-methyltransferase